MRCKALVLVPFLWTIVAPALCAQVFDYGATGIPTVSVDGEMEAEARAFPSVGCLGGLPPAVEDYDASPFLPMVTPVNLIDCPSTGTSPTTDQSWQGAVHAGLVKHTVSQGLCTRVSTADADLSALLELVHDPTLIQLEGRSEFDHTAASKSNCSDPMGCTNGGIARSAIDGGLVGEPQTVVTIPFVLTDNAELLIQPHVDIALDPGSLGITRSSITWEFDLLGVGIWEFGSLPHDLEPHDDCVFFPAGSYELRIGHSNFFEVEPTQATSLGKEVKTLSGEDCWELRVEIVDCM